MAWPEGDVFPDGWSNAAFGAQWGIDTAVYASAGSSLGASASSFDSATLSAPSITLAAAAEASFALRLDGAAGTFTARYRPDGGSITTLLSLTVDGLVDWHTQTVVVPSGTGVLSFRIQGTSGASTYAWLDDVVLPGAAAADVLMLPWQVVVSPPAVVLQWPVRIGDVAAALWPVEVLPPRTVTEWVIDIGAAPQVHASAPWFVRIGVAGGAVASWPIGVLDAGVTAGLGGAAGWAAAPDGRWRLVIALDGADVSDRVVGLASIEIADDAARTARFAFLPSAPLQPLALIGRPVQIYFAQADGANAQLMFSGVIETPRIDVDTGLVSCDCHDQAQEIWSNLSRAAIDGIVGGRWHVALGDEADGFQYMRARLESVGASWSLDEHQRPRITPWHGLPRSVSVHQADVVDGSVSVSLPSRSDLRSRITCRLQYRYTRLRWRGAVAQYNQPLAFYVRPDLEKGIVGKQWLSRAQIMSALEGVSDWDLVGEVTIEQPRPQAISPPAAVGGLGGVYMITAQSAQELALGFRAFFRTRWEQSVTEDWSVTLVWPDIEEQLGRPVSEEMGATLEASFDSPAWIVDPTVLPLNGTIYQGDIISSWQPEGADIAARDELLRILLDRAWVRMWGASRSGRIRFQLPCRPDIGLDTWVELQADRVIASGKVIEIEHALDQTSGKAVTTITLAVGMPGATPAVQPVWTVPPAPEDSYSPPLNAYVFHCGTYVGGELLSPPFDDAEMVGFCTNIEDAAMTDIDRDARNWYPHQLSIRAPDLAAEDRDPLELSVAAEVLVTIPTDQLEIH